MLMCLIHSNTHYRQCLMEIKFVVSCLMKCQSEWTCISIRSSAVLMALRTLEDGRTSNIANHALVFMIRGLCKRWKQPVAYCLIHRSTKGEMLVNFLMEFLNACLNAGLEVVATVCDVGCQQCQGLETVGCFWKDTFLQVSWSRNCSYIWSSPLP